MTANLTVERIAIRSARRALKELLKERLLSPNVAHNEKLRQQVLFCIQQAYLETLQGLE